MQEAHLSSEQGLQVREALLGKVAAKPVSRFLPLLKRGLRSLPQSRREYVLLVIVEGVSRLARVNLSSS
jgi:hypothetical protein